MWGNPPDENSLGMLFPENTGPLDSAAWAFNITFSEIWYVEDDEAEKIDYDEMLVQLKEEIQEENQQRTETGYETIELIGWASKPYYDRDRKVLHWAKEIKFGDYEINTLNYEIRLLGRKGVLSLNAIGSMEQIQDVRSATEPAIIFDRIQRW